MKLSQCMTFTAIAATLLSTQTAARMGLPKADKDSTQDQYYETVLVQAKADKASYEKVIRSPTYVATPYPDSRFVDNPMAKAGKEGSHKGVRNLDRYGTAVLVSDVKADKEGSSHHSANRYESEQYQEDVDFFIGSPGKEGDRCKLPFPNCGKGLRCRNRSGDHPICHRNDVCRPRGMQCVLSRNWVLGRQVPIGQTFLYVKNTGGRNMKCTK